MYISIRVNELNFYIKMHSLIFDLQAKSNSAYCEIPPNKTVLSSQKLKSQFYQTKRKQKLLFESDNIEAKRH